MKHLSPIQEYCEILKTVFILSVLEGRYSVTENIGIWISLAINRRKKILIFEWHFLEIRLTLLLLLVHPVSLKQQLWPAWNYLPPPHHILCNVLLVEEQHISNQGEEKITHVHKKCMKKSAARKFCQGYNINLEIHTSLPAYMYMQYLSGEQRHIGSLDHGGVSAWLQSGMGSSGDAQQKGCRERWGRGVEWINR